MRHHVVDLTVGTTGAKELDKFIDLLSVRGANEAGINLQTLAGFHINKPRCLLERKLDLRLVEDVKQNHLVMLVTKMVQRSNDLFGVIVQVADQNDQTTAFESFGQSMQGVADIGGDPFR